MRIGIQLNPGSVSSPQCLFVQADFDLDFIHSFIPDISIAPLQVHYYSEALPTTALYSYWYCVELTRRSATGNHEWMTWFGSPSAAQFRKHFETSLLVSEDTDPGRERLWY